MRGWAWASFVLLGCGPLADGPAATTTDATVGSTAGDASTSGVADDDATDAPGSSTSSDPDEGSSGAVETTADESGSSTGAPPFQPLMCDGSVYECGDGRDNDGDGLVDLDDPECTSPCDDREDSLSTGLNHFNDCKIDCAWDSNEGAGDDQCLTDLKCDPESPGEDLSCAYSRVNNCANKILTQTEMCLETCMPYVIPGCDCFGCCELEGWPTAIQFTAADDGCTVATPENCPPCTQEDSCTKPCDPLGCQLCFGQSVLAIGCDAVSCPGGTVCESSAECTPGGYCLQGCCYPEPF